MRVELHAPPRVEVARAPDGALRLVVGRATVVLRPAPDLSALAAALMRHAGTGELYLPPPELARPDDVLDVLEWLAAALDRAGRGGDGGPAIRAARAVLSPALGDARELLETVTGG